MKKLSIALENSDGSLQRMIGAGEARWLLDRKRAKRVNKPRTSRMTIRLMADPKPSTSKESPCVITIADIETVAGIRHITARRRERLIGFGLLKEKISSYASGVRTLRNECEQAV